MKCVTSWSIVTITECRGTVTFFLLVMDGFATGLKYFVEKVEILLC